MESAAVSALLKRLDLRPLKGAAKAKIRTFSGGNQQKAIIARWLLGSADIFLFDEPTQGIDVGAREQVYEVIRELAEKGAGTAVIVVSSDAEESAPAFTISLTHSRARGGCHPPMDTPHRSC